MSLGAAIAVGAVIGLALGILVSVTTDVPLAPEIGLVLGALVGWLWRREQGIGPMKQRVSLVTLGVRDLARARRFYEALGWETGAGPDDDVVFFQAGDMVVALWDRARLAEDSCVEDAGGWGGVTLAMNVGSPEEVDAVTEEARAAGATIGREPAETFWGGYSSAFIDPEGHPWEVAHNPHWTITEDGGVRLG